MAWYHKALALIPGGISVGSAIGAVNVAIQIGIKYAVAYSTAYDQSLDIGESEAKDYPLYAPPHNARNISTPYDPSWNIDNLKMLGLYGCTLLCLLSSFKLGKKITRGFSKTFLPKALALTCALGSAAALVYSIISMGEASQRQGEIAGNDNGQVDGYNYIRCALYPISGCTVPEKPHFHPTHHTVDTYTLMYETAALLASTGLFSAIAGRVWTAGKEVVRDNSYTLVDPSTTHQSLTHYGAFS